MTSVAKSAFRTMAMVVVAGVLCQPLMIRDAMAAICPAVGDEITGQGTVTGAGSAAGECLMSDNSTVPAEPCDTGSYCNTGMVSAAAVPEMSPAAAAGFLGLALLIGWRVRRKYRPAI